MIEIKKVVKVDEEDFIRLYKDAGWWRDDWNMAFINQAVKGSFCFFAAFDGEKMIGMGRALSDGVSDAYIQDVVVLKEYRGKGIGKKIVQEIINYLKNNGVDWIGLISEPDAIDFHSKNGFHVLKNYVPMKLRDN